MTVSVRDEINVALKGAMKAQEKRRTATLRLMNAAIKDRMIQNRTAGKGDEVEDSEILEILAKMIKQRRESADTYEGAGRLEESLARTAQGHHDALDDAYTLLAQWIPVVLYLAVAGVVAVGLIG